MGGMLRSRVINANLVFSATAKASLPELPSTTQYPALSSILLNNLRSSGLSSTTNIDCFFVSAIFIHISTESSTCSFSLRETQLRRIAKARAQKARSLEVYAHPNSGTLDFRMY